MTATAIATRPARIESAISAGVTEVLEVGTLGALGLWLVAVAAGTRRVAELWPLWVLPLALTVDNLAFGVASDYSGSLLAHAAEQALSSSLLALIGLYAAGVLPRVLPALERPTVAVRFAGAALLVTTGGFVCCPSDGTLLLIGADILLPASQSMIVTLSPG